jgi:hypothetical protein
MTTGWPSWGQLLGHHTGRHIGHAAGPEGHDDADGSVGQAFGLGGGGKSAQQGSPCCGTDQGLGKTAAFHACPSV